jgi:hypothetical protein
MRVPEGDSDRELTAIGRFDVKRPAATTAERGTRRASTCYMRYKCRFVK